MLVAAKRKFRDRILHEMLHVPYRLRVRYRRLGRPFAVTYVFIHGLADTGELWRPFLDNVPSKCNYIVVDLLGHGDSYIAQTRRMYSAREQARHLLTTCLTNGLSGPVVLVGHSFGSLVAIEFASMYKGIVKQCILVAPPIYRDNSKKGAARLRQDSLLRDIYRQALKTPKTVVTGYDLYSKLGLAGFSETRLTRDNFTAFRDTLLAGIISQSAGRKIADTDIDTDIIYGKLDPFIVEKNLKNLAKNNSHITLHSLTIATHAIRERTRKVVVRCMKKAVKTESK